MNDLIKYYDELQKLEEDYRCSYLSSNPEYVKSRDQLQWDAQSSDMVTSDTMEAIDYVHHNAFNRGYREGFALANKQGEEALRVATELLRRSEKRVTEQETLLENAVLQSDRSVYIP